MLLGREAYECRLQHQISWRLARYGRAVAAWSVQPWTMRRPMDEAVRGELYERAPRATRARHGRLQDRTELIRASRRIARIRGGVRRVYVGAAQAVSARFGPIQLNGLLLELAVQHVEIVIVLAVDHVRELVQQHALDAVVGAKPFKV